MSKARKSILIVCITLLIMLIPVLLCNNRITRGTSFIYSDPDSLFYYRIVDQALQKGNEKYLDYDNYGNFPYDFKIGYPRLYYWLLYFIKYLCTKLSPDNSEFLFLSLPVLTTTLTALIIVISFCFLKYPLLFVVLTAFVLLPSLPAFLVGSFSKLDYDHILSLYLWLWLLSSMFYQDSQNKKWLYLGSVFAGLVLGSWIGSLLIFTVVALVCFCLWFINSKLCEKYLPFCYITFGLATLINALIILVSPGRYGTVLLDFGIIHISAMVLETIGLFVLSRFKATNKIRAVLLFLAVVIPLIYYLINPSNFIDLIGKVFGTDPIYVEIQELQPLIELRNKTFSNIGIFNKAIINYGYLFFLFPIVLFCSVKRDIGKDSASLLKLWTIIIFFAGVYQVRYIRIFGIGCCIYAAFILFYCLCRFKEKFKNKLKPLTYKIILIFIILLSLLIVRYTSMISLFIPNQGIRLSELDAYRWIKANTPATSGYYDSKKPEYGILAYWDFGHQINFFAHRPVIANNMQNGVKNMAAIFSSKNEETAYKLCEDLKVKYVFMAPDRVLFPSTIDYWPAYKDQEPGPGYKALPYNVERSKDYDKWFFTWLNNSYGLMAKGGFDVTSHFRIIFGNAERKSPTFSTLLFERVKGAKLTIKAKPNSNALVSLRFNVRGRLLNYFKVAKVSEKGSACFTLPYSCYFNNRIVRTAELYNISFVSHETNKKIMGKVLVKEEDVIMGNEVATSSIFIFK